MHIDQLVDQIDQVPVMAPVHARLVRMIQASDVSAKELSEAISGDPSLTAHVLRLVNSAVYGFPRQVGTVSQAVLLLGFDAIAQQVLGHARRALMEPAERAGPLDFRAFWQHSVAVAAGARILARRVAHRNEEALFVAGLLHDIGRVLLAQYMPDALERAMERAWRLRLSLYDAERQTIGFTHCRLGERMAMRWDLPDLVVDAVAFHHEPDVTERHSLETRIIEAADILAKAMSLGSSGNDRVTSIPARTREMLDLDADEIEPLMEAVRTAFYEVSAYVLGVLKNDDSSIDAEKAKNEVKQPAETADALPGQ
ncbi:MAG: HDOD domain-containing protein [Verrucomicrobia bacterium]|nr:HDOD domain-containing protein [Verrucomicrobiota bacterium]